MGGRRKYRGWVVLSVAALRRQRQNLCMHDPRAGASLEVRLFRLAIKRVECGLETRSRWILDRARRRDRIIHSFV